MFNPIDWSLVFSSQFWFGIDRFKGVSMADKIILWFGVALLVVGIIVLVYRLVSKNHLLKPALGRISSVFITIGLLEMLWFLLRSQFVTALGTRTAALLVALTGLAFLIKPIRYFFTQYSQDHAAYIKQKQKDKYLQLK